MSSLTDIKINTNYIIASPLRTPQAPILLYKYLGVIFDPKLCWSLQHIKTPTITTFWSSRIWRLSKLASGMSTSGIKQLYNAVAVPRFTYGAEVWYTYLYKLANSGKTHGSVGITNQLLLTLSSPSFCVSYHLPSPFPFLLAQVPFLYCMFIFII